MSALRHGVGGLVIVWVMCLAGDRVPRHVTCNMEHGWWWWMDSVCVWMYMWMYMYVSMYVSTFCASMIAYVCVRDITVNSRVKERIPSTGICRVRM